MSYEQIMELIYNRNINGKVPALTEEEARQYYGARCCDLIEKIYRFCREAGYTIYQHATNVESADNIMNKGFYGTERFIQDLPINIKNRQPDYIETDEDGIKTKLYDGGKCQTSEFMPLFDQLSDGQHFFENINCFLDFGSLTNPNVNRNSDGFGATVLFAVSKSISGSRDYEQYGVKDSYYDDCEDREVSEEYFERHVVPKQFCIGYLDVKNKRFVANPNFRFNYGITDEFELGTTSSIEQDLSNDLNNSMGRRI